MRSFSSRLDCRPRSRPLCCCYAAPVRKRRKRLGLVVSELPPAVAYLYSEDRTYDQPQLAGFSGVLQVDGWGGFKRLTGGTEAGALILAFCWSHARRQFYEIHQATQSPAR